MVTFQKRTLRILISRKENEKKRGVAAGGSREAPHRGVRSKFKFKSPWAGHCFHVRRRGRRAWAAVV